MEFPYSLIWNDTWNFVLKFIFNPNISIVKTAKSNKIELTKLTRKFVLLNYKTITVRCVYNLGN